MPPWAPATRPKWPLPMRRPRFPDANTAGAEEMTVSDLIDDAMTATADIDDKSTPAAVAAGRAAIDAAQESLDVMENLSADATTALQGRINDLEAGYSPIEMTVKTNAATAAAGTKRAEIAVEAGEMGEGEEADAGLGGSTAPEAADAVGSYTLSIERDRMATKVTVTVNGTAEDDSDDVEFMPQDMDLGAGNSMHVRKMVADAEGNVVEEVVIVSTDIEAPKATAFGMVHTLDVRADGVVATEAMPNDALNIDADELANVKASAFVAPAGTVGTTLLTFQQAVPDDVDTMDVDEAMAAAEIMGTFNGAMGTYKCAADTACSVTVNTMGVVSAVSDPNDWVFIPSDGVKIDVADADYMHYGFWLMRTTDEDGVLTYNEVETFAGSTVAASGSVTDVTGRATYEGGATGVYVKSVTNPDGTEASATSGHFTAKASLMATFGQVNAEGCEGDNCGTIAGSLLNTLTGDITNFALSGKEYKPWAVNLQGDIDTSNGTVTSEDGATGGGAPGSWSATFHGAVTADEEVVPKPSSVVGEFNANFSNGTVAGGFGASK